MRRFICLLALAVSIGCTSKPAVEPTPDKTQDRQSDTKPSKTDAPAPFTQTEVVKPGSFFTGTVNYPIPFAVPPHLTIVSTRREYAITQQDEFGFTWAAYPIKEDFTDTVLKDPRDVAACEKLSLTVLSATTALKPSIRCDDFTWKASGLRSDPAQLPARPFEQKGTFSAPKGETGPIHFEIPYASPPNVTLDDKYVIVVKCKADGFEWKNTYDGSSTGTRTVNWTARGVRTNKAAK